MSTNSSDDHSAGSVGYDALSWYDTPLELRHYGRVIWQRKLIVLLTVTVIIAAGGAYTYFQTPLYRSTAEVLLQPRVIESVFEPVHTASRGVTNSRVLTEIAVMRSQSVQEAVGKALGQPPRASVAQRGETDVVAITGVSETPAEAARIAQTYADTYMEIRREQLSADLQGAIDQIQALIEPIEQQLAELEDPIAALNAQIASAVTDVDVRRLQDQRDELIRQTDGRRALLQSRERSYAEQLDKLILASSTSQTAGVQLVTQAEVPNAPASPRPGQNFVVTLALGLLLGVAAAFTREHFDNTIRREKGSEQFTPDSPALGLDPNREEMESAGYGDAGRGDPTKSAVGQGVAHGPYFAAVQKAERLTGWGPGHPPKSR